MDKEQSLKIINHPFVFYILVVYTLFSILGNYYLENYTSAIILASVAFLMSRITHNPTYILFVSIVISNLYSNSLIKSSIQDMVVEGFKNKKNKKGGKKMKKNDEETEEEETETETETEEETEEEDKKENFESRKKRFRKSRPAKVKGDEALDVGDGDEEYVDYSATLQQAYKNMEGMLGKGGMKGLTKETKKLVSQQKQLMNTLNEMTPVLADAKKSLNNLNMPDMGSLQKMMGQIGKMK